MARTLDLTALRSFATVADMGGVTRAAGTLNLTQSAVSMQLKRLEEALGQALFDRSGRGIALTAQGEQLAGYARRMIALNDEALARLTGEDWEGELRFGVPHDIIYPHVPAVLAQFARTHPRVRVSLISSHTRRLLELHGRGEIDLILTTEASRHAGGETLAERNLVWIGAKGGRAWKQRPLPMAFEYICAFRPVAIRALETAEMPWSMAVESESIRTVEASVAADLGVACMLETTLPPQVETVCHGGALPDLPQMQINLYRTGGPNEGLADHLAEAVREAYRSEVPA